MRKFRFMRVIYFKMYLRSGEGSWMRLFPIPPYIPNGGYRRADDGSEGL